MVLRGMPFTLLMEEILTMCPKSCASMREGGKTRGREGGREGEKVRERRGGRKGREGRKEYICTHDQLGSMFGELHQLSSWRGRN